MKNYKDSLLATPGSVFTDEVPKVVIDYKGLNQYARKKNVLPYELTLEEKLQFVRELVPGEIAKVVSIIKSVNDE